MTLCIKLFTSSPCHTCYYNCNPIFEPTFSFFLEWLLLYFLLNSYSFFNFWLKCCLWVKPMKRLQETFPVSILPSGFKTSNESESFTRLCNQNTGVGSRSLLQGIFPTQGSNPGPPQCRQILCQLSHRGSLRMLEWLAYPFSSGSSLPRNRTGVSYIAGGFFSWATREAQ